MKFKILNKILASNIAQKLPKMILRKIFKKFRIYFVPTKLSNIPDNNYKIGSNFIFQEQLIKQFNEHKPNKLISFNTCPHIYQIIKLLFKDPDLKFNFLDFGGENIDLYLYLKKNFKNINYFIFNQEHINTSYIELKSKYKLKDFTVLNNIDELSNYEYDFVNFGGVLQYINDYDFIMKKIIKISKKYIFFSAIHFYEKEFSSLEKIVVKETNLLHILPINIYCYFFNFDIFIKSFLQNNFSIIFKENNVYGDVNYKNFDNSFNKTNYTDLLLAKK
ncbi:MAG: hypothetical protein CMI76_01820 [Candidatus Pelagibacter sp.]|nr:hypothetical protein [Candidatus Pelagibacter sp.]|tara:strand:- start:1513 stop:2340 length:828 start_codon:yes stop_codon:yes gene_type:complete